MGSNADKEVKSRFMNPQNALFRTKKLFRGEFFVVVDAESIRLQTIACLEFILFFRVSPFSSLVETGRIKKKEKKQD